MSDSRKDRKRRGVVVFLLAALLLAGGILYRCLRQNQWTVTQYGSISGGQCMCYTVTDRHGFFAIVDGGYDVDAEQVRELVRKHHNHVDVWIITHTHPDHAGAFNKIMADPSNGITVDRIYTVQANTERYRETARSYDGFETHEDFVKLTEEMDQLEYLRENDVRELDGPDFLYEEGGVYDGYLLKQHFDENGTVCHLLSQAPAKVILK